MAKRISNKTYRSVNGQETKTPNENTMAVVIKFENGQDVVVALDYITPAIRNIACCHGIAQKVGDSYAEAKGDIDLAHALAQDMATRLEQGEWNIKGEGGASASVLAQAVAETTGKSLAECIGKVSDMTKEERKTLRDHPQVKAIITRMEAERAQARLEAAQQAALDAPALTI